MNTYSKPSSARDLRENGKIILAHGEVTGHSHQIVTTLLNSTNSFYPEHDLDLELYQYFEESAVPFNHKTWTPGTPARRVLLALAPCVLRHQEHDPIYLDPKNPKQARQGDVFLNPIGEGAWEVIRQNEYTPNRIVNVAD